MELTVALLVCTIFSVQWSHGYVPSTTATTRKLGLSSLIDRRSSSTVLVKGLRRHARYGGGMIHRNRLLSPSWYHSTSSASSTSTSLMVDLWDRMGLEEDEEPFWYLLNCVAGNEMELLAQCRAQFKYLDLDPEDKQNTKFVVPTITTTRSHGAKRMVQETKVKYLGYVFAYVRLTKKTYEAIQAIPLHRSFMGGGINMQGFTKLPPAPIPLNYEEIEKYGLEEIEYEGHEDIHAALPKKNQDNLEIIVDTEELEQKEIEAESAIEEIVQTVYNGLRVEDMVKVTAKNKFHGEDGTVRRLKDGKVLIRFFTYGTSYDEWLSPTDVRVMTDAEAMKGLTGPDAPITQRDIDGGGGRLSHDRDRGDRPGSRIRNEVGTFGGGPRNRRQDRLERRYDSRKDDKGEENWRQYQEDERRQEDRGGYVDGDFEIRGSKHRRGSRNDSYSPESDVNSQWGRPSKRQERRDHRQNDEWSSSVSERPRRQNEGLPRKQENDDFFESLMADLSNDLDGDATERRDDKYSQQGQTSNRRDTYRRTGSDDDDFFAKLMAEISEDDEDGKKSDSTRKSKGGGDDDDDFFASLEREIRGANTDPHLARPVHSRRQSTRANDELDDIFAELGVSELISKDDSTTSLDDPDDFFSSLEAELANELGGMASDPQQKQQNTESSLAGDEDDFFSGLEDELNASMNSSSEESTTKEHPSKSDSTSNARKDIDVSSLTVPQLREMLRERGLKVSGKKAELIERLNSLA
jgi:transcription antitermination factor NusG